MPELNAAQEKSLQCVLTDVRSGELSIKDLSETTAFCSQPQPDLIEQTRNFVLPVFESALAILQPQEKP